MTKNATQQFVLAVSIDGHIRYVQPRSSEGLCLRTFGGWGSALKFATRREAEAVRRELAPRFAPWIESTHNAS